MPQLNEEDYNKWLVKRRRTLVVFIVQTFLIGLDVSLTYLTLWKYLNVVVKPTQPYLFYSLIFITFFIPSISLTSIVSNYIDKTRNVRRVFFIIDTLVLIGCLLYVVPISPWCLVIGRLLAGTGNSLRSVMSSEIARSYAADDLSSKLSYLGFAYSLGYVGGPGINFFFKNIDFTVFSVRVTFLNIPGLYMAVSFLILQFINVFQLSDLSKIYDMKAEGEANSSSARSNDDTNEESTDEGRPLLPKELSFTEKLKLMFSKFDLVLLFTLAFFQNYLQTCYYMWSSLIVFERLHWTISSFGWINISLGILTVIPCVLLIIYKLSNAKIFYFGLATQVALIICQISLSVLYYFNKTFTMNIVMWILYCSMWVVLVVGEEVVLVGILAQLVSSKYQTFADGMRLTFFRTGAVVGFLMSSLMFHWLNVVAFFHIIILIILLVVMIARRDNLRCPQIIV